MLDMEIINPCAVVPHDERQSFLARRIAHFADCSEPGEDPSRKAVFLPMTPGDYLYAIRCLAPAGYIICYTADSKLKQAAKERELNIIELGKDESFVAENAVITAECAIGLAIIDLKTRVSETRFAIIGGGRIATALTMMLVKMDAAGVTVFARNPIQRENARYIGAHAFNLHETSELDGVNAVFNTVPSLVLDEEGMKHLAPGCFLYELASQDGFDRSLACHSGHTAVRAGGLPGRYAPKSAADLILKHSFLHMTEE